MGIKGQLPAGDEQNRIDVTGRRAAIKLTASMLGGMAATAVAIPAAVEASPDRRAGNASIIAQNGVALTAIESGKVIGYVRNGINTFKGIPYGESTAGANRFMPPAKAKPWSGVRSARQFGNVAPQGPRAGWANDEEAFMFSWDDGVQGEDCLRVNVWTPGIADGKKRPVMVWLHGGGFAAGSGQELLSYDGENLAKRGDVVVVTLNHRLNVFGYLNLSQYGPEFAASANVGMLDIVAALEWVRDNIAAFGGDPQTVTIFGQSGGGGKVSTLMGMPAAKGLFHRAIVESGSMLRVGTEEKSRELADLVVRALGLNQASIGEIRTLPFDRVLSVSLDVLREHNPMKPGTLPNFRRMADMLGFAPVMDGKLIPAQPFDPTASSLSADVPMIIGSTLNEFVTALNHPEYEQMSADELQEKVSSIYGDKALSIIAAFRRRTPSASPFDLWSRIAAAGVRQAAIAQAAAKTALHKAPAYLYWFTWQTPILNGRPRAFHCAEIPFVFDNTDRCENMTGGGSDARALGEVMSDAWIQFARTGNPNHSSMPNWEAFDSARLTTMIFDRKVTARPAPDAGEQASIQQG